MDLGIVAVMPASKWLEVDETYINYYEEGAGEVIMLLHGWPQTAHVWRKVFPLLKDKYRVIALDLPGTGDSGPAKAYDTLSIATLISHFAAQLNIEKFHLVGHDIGSWVAASFALHFEPLLKSLTVIDAGIPGLMPEAAFHPDNAVRVWQFYFHAIQDLPEFLIEGKEREYLSWYLTNKSHIKTAITEDDLEVYYRAFLEGNGFGYYRNFTTSASQNKAVTQRLKVPVLAVGGESALGMNVGIAMQKVAGNVTNVSLPACGHYVPEEQPGMLTDLILKNMEGL